MILALAGDRAGAERLLTEAEAAVVATDTLQQAVSLPTARAAIALARAEPQRALEALRPAEPYDRGRASTLYLRAQALAALGRPADAAVAFKRVADEALSSGFGPFYLRPLAVLGMARASAAAGDAKGARAAYDRLLAEWSQADAGLPVLIRAKGESLALASGGDRAASGPP